MKSLTRSGSLAMAAAGAALFAGVGLTSAPASAMPAGAAPQVLASGTAPLLTDVQWRNDRWRYGNRYGHRGWGGPRYGYRRGWGGGWDNGGAAAAAGIAGLATGAILGGVLSQPRTVVEEPVYGGYPAYGGGGDAVGYCAQRFRSYDPASGTYLGYDGLRHPCP